VKFNTTTRNARQRLVTRTNTARRTTL